MKCTEEFSSCHCRYTQPLEQEVTDFCKTQWRIFMTKTSGGLYIWHTAASSRSYKEGFFSWTPVVGIKAVVLPTWALYSLHYNPGTVGIGQSVQRTTVVGYRLNGYISVIQDFSFAAVGVAKPVLRPTQSADRNAPEHFARRWSCWGAKLY